MESFFNIESLFKKDDDGTLRLARVAIDSEIENATINNQNVFVVKKDLESSEKYIRFFHFNKVGRKIYRTVKEKIVKVVKEVSVSSHKNYSTKLIDVLNKETIQALMKIGKK